MKKILLTTLAIGLLVSCRKDDDNNNSNDIASIVGTWKAVKKEVISGKDMKKILEIELSNDCQKSSTFEFTTDNKYNVVSYDNFAGKCVIEDQFSISYSYNSTTKKLTVKHSSAEAYEGTVEQLTTTKLQVMGEYLGDYDKDGTNDYERTYYER